MSAGAVSKSTARLAGMLALRLFVAMGKDSREIQHPGCRIAQPGKPNPVRR
jgi:hypothetical protein